ncbi:MAG: SGNH/GDSL hydrolase family protein [Gemmatimonadaceae bacterium]|jgi:hypothetical protein|nr:SGNH/GDSL hydrolase family protein [Gemmatimonadaceae bacterium]
MPSRKSAGRSRKAAVQATSADRKALTQVAPLSQAQVKETLRDRRETQRARAKILPKMVTKSSPSASPLSSRLSTLVGDRGLATLIAEGDSWFDYFGYDVLNKLERLGYDVESVARAGDTVEAMAYNDGQLKRLCSVIDKQIRTGRIPKAILLSGGGNDVAGREFAQLLNHAMSPAPGPNEDIVRGVIDVRARDAYLTILTSVKDLTTQMVGKPIPVLVHGYGRPRPDGRGVIGGWGPLPGPWLRPGFNVKGYSDEQANTAVIGALIDRFNAMLQRITSLSAFGHVHYVDVRGVLINGTGYKKDWGNELHPTTAGFERVAAEFAKVLHTLP